MQNSHHSLLNLFKYFFSIKAQQINAITSTTPIIVASITDIDQLKFLPKIFSKTQKILFKIIPKTLSNF